MKLLFVPAGQIKTSNAFPEENITSDQKILCLAIKTNARRRMAGRKKDGQLIVT
jgi:hypothetical protein